MLGAGLGGFEGRALRKRDRLAIGEARDGVARDVDDGATDSTPGEPADDRAERDGALHILRGPDASEDAFQRLLAGRYVISNASDRTGTRLESVAPPSSTPLSPPALAATTHRSQPMVVGAIEQTPHGLIVLGRDHPTTGGYPVVAVLTTASLDPFFALPPGSHVSFSGAPR
jgi:allophanate hydrolase subunit 2